MFMDGEAMPVSESMGDPDAKRGADNGRFSRGYTIHALTAEDSPGAWPNLQHSES